MIEVHISEGGLDVNSCYEPHLTNLAIGRILFSLSTGENKSDLNRERGRLKSWNQATDIIASSISCDKAGIIVDLWF